MGQHQYIYADNAATTRLSPLALEAMIPYLKSDYGNASQPYSFSRTAKKAIRDARAVIAECIGANPDEIYFTSCGTDSDNWVISGAMQKRLPIVTSTIEHHAVLNPCECASRKGHKVTLIPVNSNGEVHPRDLQQALDGNKGIISIMYANNEIGTIQPIKDLVDLAHRQGWIFHTDAVQAVGHCHFNVHELGVEMLSASAHKFNGPKGIGFLYIKKGLEWPPLICGGGQENGMRAGTENVSSIVAMATALQENVSSIDETTKSLTSLEHKLLEELSTLGVAYLRNGGDEHLAGNISLSFPNSSGETLLHRLDLMGIFVSTGSACDSKNTQVSHVLKAIHLKDELAKGTIRISLGRDNTMEDVKRIASAIATILL